MLLEEHTHMIAVRCDFKAEHKPSEFQAWTAFEETQIRSTKTSAGLRMIREIGKQWEKMQHT